MRRPLPAVALCVALLLGAGCATSGARTDNLRGDRKLQVVAAENFWGSIAAQLGGTHVEVTSIIATPTVDPHGYEPTAADARASPSADLVIVNGMGYDAWAARLVGADPSHRAAVVDVGRLVGVAVGDNPHRWYYPADVDRWPTAITAAYQASTPRTRRVLRTPRWSPSATTGTGRLPPLVADISAAATPARRSARPRASSRRSPGLGLRPRHARAASSTPSARAPTPPQPTRPRSTSRSPRHADPRVRLQPPERHARRAGAWSCRPAPRASRCRPSPRR